jgi:hypothetical protein
MIPSRTLSHEARFAKFPEIESFNEILKVIPSISDFPSNLSHPVPFPYQSA